MWTGSIIIAVALNVILFSLMPRLIQSENKHPQEYEKIQTVNFIRIKQKEIPPKHKEIKKEEPEKKPPEKQNIVKAVTSPPIPSFKKPEFPFELNPRLPVGEIQLPAPDINPFLLIPLK